MLRIESTSIDGREAAPGTPSSGAPAAAGNGATGTDATPGGTPSPERADRPAARPDATEGLRAGGPASPEPDDGSATPWQRWLETPPGRYLLAWEQAQFDAAVADVFGYHALQCGEPAIDALRSNRMPHRFSALLPDDPRPADPTRSALRIEHAEELPFESQSLDLVVLPHVLEFAHDPHQVLREADRVLRPEGRLIVSGFNPVSLWGARHVVPSGALSPFPPRPGHFIGVPRLRDWCKLLSFESERARYGCWRPPCRTQLWLDRTGFMERAGDRWWPICGAAYLLVAIKRVRGMRLVGKAWRRPASARAIAVPSAQREGLPPDGG